MPGVIPPLKGGRHYRTPSTNIGCANRLQFDSPLLSVVRPPSFTEAMSENGQEGEKDYQVNMGFSGDKGYGATEPAPGDTSDTAKVVTATAAANKVARWL